MSSKRGRKRNDNLPPNRARDVQRAFRARRAAHLQALELRVTELEEENDCLRQALNLPPANRPPLGKGPTGKDKPRTLEQALASSSAINNGPSNVASLLSSRGSSSAESPASTRAESHSPPVIGGTPRSAPPQLDSHPTWDQGMLNNMGDHGQHQPHHNHPQHHHPAPVDPSAHPSSSSSYHLPPMSAPPPPSAKPQHLQYHYGSGNSPTQSPPTARGPVPGSVYVNYPHSTDRPMENSYPSSSSNYSVRNDEDPRQYSPYAPSSYDSSTSLHHHAAHHPGMQPHASHREAPPSPAIPYPHPPRRELSGGGGNYGIGDHFPHLPTPGGSHSIRLPSPSTLPVGMGGGMPQHPPLHHHSQHSQPQHRPPYENRMPHPLS